MDDASDSVNKICLYGILFIGGGGALSLGKCMNSFPFHNFDFKIYF